MTSTFQSNVTFNQDLTTSNFAGVTNMTNCFTSSGLSTANYGLLLIRLNAAGTSGVTLGAGTIKYSSADSAVVAARAALVSRSWVITDGGPIP